MPIQAPTAVVIRTGSSISVRCPIWWFQGRSEQERSDLHKLLQKIPVFVMALLRDKMKALAQALSIADQFRGLSALSSLDLSVEVVRSVVP